MQFVRPEAEIREIARDNVLGEPRFDPDGSFDILKWSRPQHDGPALRTLDRAAILFFRRRAMRRRCALASQLLLRDLAFTPGALASAFLRHLGRGTGPPLLHPACAVEALSEGARWLEEDRRGAGAQGLSRGVRGRSKRQLREFWSDDKAFTAAGSARTA